MEVLDGRVRVTLIDKLIEVKEVDQSHGEVVSFERHLRIWVTTAELGD